MCVLPDHLEICIRDLDGYPCRGVLHRRGLDNTLPYCQKCGSVEPGVMFVKADAITIEDDPLFIALRRDLEMSTLSPEQIDALVTKWTLECEATLSRIRRGQGG